jgi:hypothetical protein
MTPREALDLIESNMSWCSIVGCETCKENKKALEVLQELIDREKSITHYTTD